MLFHSGHPLMRPEIEPCSHLTQVSSCRISGVHAGTVMFEQKRRFPVRLAESSPNPQPFGDGSRQRGDKKKMYTCLRSRATSVAVWLRAGLEATGCQAIALLSPLCPATCRPSTSGAHCSFYIACVLERHEAAPKGHTQDRRSNYLAYNVVGCAPSMAPKRTVFKRPAAFKRQAATEAEPSSTPRHTNKGVCQVHGCMCRTQICAYAGCRLLCKENPPPQAWAPES